MKWIIRYLISKEVYRKYNENRTEISELFSFQNITRFFWSLIGLIFIIGSSFAFSNRNNLKLSELNQNDSLYVKPWKRHFKNEIRFYRFTVKNNLYAENKKDTLFHYKNTFKTDTIGNKKQLIGIYSGENSENEDGIFISINKSVKITKPKWDDFIYSKTNKYSKNYYVSIDDIITNSVKKPESRWFQHFLLLLFMFFSFRKIRISLFRLFKTKVPVFDREAVRKRDNRYKSGHKIVGYKNVIREYRKMDNEELTIHRKQQKSRLLVGTLIFSLSFAYLYYIYTH